jgi:hypothetical protein
MNTFLAIFNAFPAILASVQAVEAAIPLPKAGQQKLNLVLDAAGTAWEIGATGKQITRSTLLSGIGAIVNLAVAGLNAAGVFHNSPAAAPPATIATPVSSN